MCMIVRTAAWLVWGVMVITFLAFVPASKELAQSGGLPLLNELDIARTHVLEAALTLSAFITVIGTAALRLTALSRPARSRTAAVGTVGWKLRFLFVHLLNWVAVGYVQCAGVVIALVTRKVDWLYAFSVIYLCAMAFHAPREDSVARCVQEK